MSGLARRLAYTIRGRARRRQAYAIACPKFPGARADDRSIVACSIEEVVGAAPLEAADRVDRLDLEGDRAPQVLRQRFAVILRRAGEHRTIVRAASAMFASDNRCAGRADVTSAACSVMGRTAPASTARVVISIPSRWSISCWRSSLMSAGSRRHSRTRLRSSSSETISTDDDVPGRRGRGRSCSRPIRRSCRRSARTPPD